MKNITYILLVLLFCSCGKDKSVLLPEIKNAKITEVLDVSPAYIFYDETQPDSTLFNRKNIIGSTNWLVNVDKRLTLQQVLPHLQYLQDKRNKASMHKNESAKNYFTCNDTSIKNIGFIEFTDIVYRTDDIANFITELFVNPSKTHQEYYANFINTDSLVVGNQTFIKGINKTKFVETLQSQTQNDTLKPKLYLTFSKALNFQDYISIKSEIHNIENLGVIIDKNEFIY
jgi:hypothetical protein